MSYGYSGQRANLGPSERRKGQWTRCAEVLMLCCEGPQSIKQMSELLGMSRTKVAECLTKLRRRGLMVEGWGCCKPTDAGLTEYARLWPQKRTG